MRPVTLVEKHQTQGLGLGHLSRALYPSEGWLAMVCFTNTRSPTPQKTEARHISRVELASCHHSQGRGEQKETIKQVLHSIYAEH